MNTIKIGMFIYIIESKNIYVILYHAVKEINDKMYMMILLC